MVRILTDSACDMPPSQAKEMGIDIVPNIVTFPNGTVIRDGVDMDSDEFYRYMAKTRQIPTTSHPSPDVFRQYYEDAKQAGDSVVTVCLSSALSSLVHSAKLGAQLAEFSDGYIIDSYQASLSQQLQVRRAVRMRDAGASAAEIAMTLEREKRHIHLLGMVEDLDHLRRGGRVNILAAITGSMMGIKPLIEINGMVNVTGKARGWRAACDSIIRNLEDMGGLDPKREYMLGYSVDPSEVSRLQEYITKKLHLPPAEIGQIGASVGTHVGPGTFGIVFYDTAPYLW